MNQKGFSTVLIVLAVLVLVMVSGTAYYLGSMRNSTINQSPLPSSTLNPTFTAKEVNSDKANLYKDNYLKVQFNYPGELSLNSLEAEKSDPRSIIYIARNPTKERQEVINYVVKCNKDNRVDPAGICVEGIIADLDIYIFKDTFDPVTYMNEESNEQCQKEKFGGKTIYSCITAGLDGKETYRYSVYLDSPRIKMMIDTRDKINNQEIIKIIIDSFRVQ
jgi:hypothetical protein